MNTVNVQTLNGGASPLYLAACNGHLDIIQLLVLHKASINQANDRGETPLWIATRNGIHYS